MKTTALDVVLGLTTAIMFICAATAAGAYWASPTPKPYPTKSKAIMTTYKALDHYDALQAGHTYERVQSTSKRLVRLEDVSSHDCLSLYQWQVEDALLRNKLIVVPDVQSPSMADVQLCQRTSSGFAY